MSNAEIIAKATVTDYMGTKEPYVELAVVRHYSPELAAEIEAENEAHRSSDPFEGTEFAA